MAEEKADGIEINVQDIEVGPSECPVDSPLDLKIVFTANAPISNASWTVQYMVDSVRKRSIIILGEEDKKNYPAGKFEFAFSVDAVDVSDIKPSHLTNAGLLTATLKSNGVHVIDINMVVQVNEVKGEYIRTIFNPLD